MGARVFLVCLGIVMLTACGQSNPCGPGERGCACVQQSCNTGLVCSAGSCVDESRAGLSVDGKARGCEVVLRDAEGGKLARVAFADDVQGKWLRQGDKIAAAFIAKDDRSIGGGAVQVAYAAGGDAFEILKSHC